MASLDHIRALYDYNAWANEHLLEAASSVDEAELAKELGASFGSVEGNLLRSFDYEWYPSPEYAERPSLLARTIAEALEQMRPGPQP